MLEDSRELAEVYVPIAHSEGGLSASMQRGIAAVLEGEPITTHVIRDRLTRALCFLFQDTGQAAAALCLALSASASAASAGSRNFVLPHTR